MGHVKQFVRPASLKEAVSLLKEYKGKAALLAGGTSLCVRMPPGVEALVDMSRLGLSGVELRDGKLCIKACTTLSELSNNEYASTLYQGLLRKAALRIGSTPLRNLITVGGNAFHVLPWSDLPGVLLATRAEFVLAGDEYRAVQADEFYSSSPRTMVKPHEILTEIRIPVPAVQVGASFQKVSKTRFDYAAISVTAVCHMMGSTVQDCRVVLGSVRGLPLRATAAEEAVRGKTPTRQEIVAGSARVAGSVEPGQDFRYSQDYRRHLVKVWVRRCLQEATGLL